MPAVIKNTILIITQMIYRIISKGMQRTNFRYVSLENKTDNAAFKFYIIKNLRIISEI